MSQNTTLPGSLLGSFVCGQNKTFSIIFNQCGIRGLSTTKGLFNTKKKIRRNPRILTPEDDHKKEVVVGNAKNEDKDDLFSDKFAKGEVS